MERKYHLDSGNCEGVPPGPSVAAKKIVKNDNDVYVCKICNTEIRHRNNVSPLSVNDEYTRTRKLSEIW